MNLSNTLKELLWENPMTLEATRTLRRSLRSGNNNENPYATRNLNRFLVGTLGFLYLWTMFGIVRSGENISIFLLVAELVLLTLVVPCSLYGAIAVEREKLTYESLIMTRLSPAQIVCGKLWWRVGLILGVMGLFVPLLVASQLCGRNLDSHGFTISQIAWSQVQIFAWGVCLAAFSLWVSAKSKKGITALLGIVAALVTFLVMVPLLFSLFGGFSTDTNQIGAFNSTNDYPYTQEQLSEINHYRRLAVLILASNLVYTLNPFVMMTSLPGDFSNGSPHSIWHMLGVNYWGVVIFIGMAAGFIRSSIKILRGLEMPVAEKVRKSRMPFAFSKGDA